MIDKSETLRKGVRIQETWSGANMVSSTRTANIINQQTILTVQDGLVQGDKKRPNPIKFDIIRNTYGYGRQISGDSHNYIVNEGSIFGSSMVPDDFYRPKMDISNFNSLRNRCLDNLGEQVRGKLDVIVDLIEIHKTRHMVDQALNLVKFVAGLNRRLRDPRGWANSWLEYQYGWRPLVSSIYGTFQQFMRPPRPGTARFVARAHEDFSQRRSSSDPLKVTWVTHGSKRYEIKIFMDLSESAVATLSGYTSLNPVSIAWEVVPYSFVVDWIYDIGSYLRNMETAYLSNALFRSGYSTSTYLERSEGSVSGAESTGPGSQTLVASQMWTTRKGKNRTVLSSYPFPDRPSMKVDLGSSQMISAGALLLQAVSGKTIKF